MKPIKTAQRPQTGKARETLLYVEDDDANWRVAVSGLAQDYEVLRAKNARDACRLVRECDGRFYAVLMDIELQGSDLNGIQLTKVLLQKPFNEPLPMYAKDLPLVQAPVLFVTAYGETISVNEMHDAGAMRIISKPVNFMELMRALTRIHLDSMNRSMTRLKPKTGSLC